MGLLTWWLLAKSDVGILLLMVPPLSPNCCIKTNGIDLTNRNSPLNRLVHIINVDIKDNHEEALVGGKGILELANMLSEAAREEREKAGPNFSRETVDGRVPEVLAKWQERFPGLPALWTVGYF